MKPSTYWKCLLAAAVAVSVAGNTGHVLLAGGPHPWAAAALAAVPPLALVAITEGLTLSVGRGRRRWAYRAGATGAVAIAGGAFVISFVALRDLTITLLPWCPAPVAALMPLVIDAAIAVSSVMALATATATEAATDTVPATTTDTSPVATAPAATVPATSAPAAPATPATSPVANRKPTTRKSTVARNPGAPAGAGAGAVAGPDAEYMGLAAQLVAEGRVRADPAIVAAALAGIASGRSHRSVALETGLHRTVVGRLAERAAEAEEGAAAA